jgi:hypothetical protein
MTSVGFIILRHVNSEVTDKYWKKSYECVRKFHPNSKIMIIDDNSNYEFIDSNYEEALENSIVIKSEFPGRGEFLPYYYFINNKLFDLAVIIHDSVFLNCNFDFSCETYKFIWCFKTMAFDQKEDQQKIIKGLNNHEELLNYHDNHRKEWLGCFGGMSIINHDFLLKINEKYDFSRMIENISTRYNRMSFERVIACILQFEHKYANVTLLGNIHDYCPWGIKYDHYDKLKLLLPLIKIWTGR